MPSSPSRRRFLGSLALGVAGVGTARGRRFAAPRASPRSANDPATDRRDPSSPERVWSRTYGSERDDELAAVVPAHGGGLLLAIEAGTDAGTWLLRTDDAGDVTWKRTYDLGEDDLPVVVRRVSDGYVVAGHSDLDGAGLTPWLLRVAPDGAERWRRRYDGPGGYRQLNAMGRSPDGGFVLAGIAAWADEDRTEGGDREDGPWLHGTDANGRTQWFRTYGDGFEGPASVARAPDGGYALVGHSDRRRAGCWKVDVRLVRTDAEGRERWRRHYGGADAERPYAACSTPTGFVLAGETDSPATPGGLLLAVDRRGRVVWRRVYPDLGVVWAVVPLSDGFGLLADRLARTDRRGILRWSYDSSVDAEPTAFARTDAGFAVGGVTPFSGGNADDAWLASVRTS